MKETEITVQVFNKLDEIDKILKSQGFKAVEKFQLNDWYFSKFDNIKGLNYPDLINNSFLVRQIISGKETIKLCFKKKEFDTKGNVIAEEKIQTKIDSVNNAIDIFKKAGLNNYCVVKNNSYVYKKNNMCFVIQVVENLGIFLEYEEDKIVKNFSYSEKFEYMKKLVNSLGLKLGQDYSCKKVFMLLDK